MTIKKSELEKIVAEKYCDHGLRDLEIRILPMKKWFKEDKTPGIAITITQMYDYVDFGFDFLTQLSELLNTKKINIGNKWHRSGCETCDYGSQYSITLNIDDVGVEIEWD